MSTKLNELKALLPQKKSRAYYAKKLGISELEVEELIKEIRNKPEVEELEGWNEDLKQGTAQLTTSSEEPIKTLDDLIRVCKIDTTVWNIDKYIQNFWGDKYQVKAFLSKIKKDEDLQNQKELILNELKAEKEKIRWAVNIADAPDWLIDSNRVGDTMLELDIPDIHIGKLSWAVESGEDYDIDIAVKRYKDAVHELLSRVDLSKVERIHLPLGNDAIHIDNSENQTTAGTAVDTDGRFAKIFRAAKKLFIEVIEELRQIAPVDVTIIRGNHDSQTMFLLGELLDAWFHGEEDIMINNSPKFRKYYKYGKNGFMYTHGDKEKHAELGQIFAHEEANLWAATKYRFCKLGHRHINRKTNKPSFKDVITGDTYIGFQVQIIPSLSGSDEWHYAHAYLGAKQAKAFLYHREKGEIGEFTITV